MKSLALSERIKNGRAFEKEAYEILKDKFVKVVWLSKEKRSIFDFKVLTNKGNWLYVEAKSTTTQNKAFLSKKQQDADYVIIKNKRNEINFIGKENFSKFLCLEKDIEYIPRPKHLIGKRLRTIKKYGKTWVIKLESSDVKDFNLKEGDVVDIEESMEKKK